LVVEKTSTSQTVKKHILLMVCSVEKTSTVMYLVSVLIHRSAERIPKNSSPQKR